MEIRYDILCESSTEISRKLEEGLLDIGIIREPMELSKLDTQFLKKEGWIVAVARIFWDFMCTTEIKNLIR